MKSIDGARNESSTEFRLYAKVDHIAWCKSAFTNVQVKKRADSKNMVEN